MNPGDFVEHFELNLAGIAYRFRYDATKDELALQVSDRWVPAETIKLGCGHEFTKAEIMGTWRRKQALDNKLN